MILHQMDIKIETNTIVIEVILMKNQYGSCCLCVCLDDF